MIASATPPAITLPNAAIMRLAMLPRCVWWVAVTGPPPG